MTDGREFRFPMQPVDETFFRSAPLRWHYELDIPQSADEVWREITVKRPLTWNRALSHIEFEGEPPYGLGAYRNIQALRTARMREYFFRWSDAEHSYSFYGTSANLPPLVSFGEDYVITDAGTGCRLSWTFAAAPRRGYGAMVRAGRPLLNAFFDSFVKDTRKHFGAA